MGRVSGPHAVGRAVETLRTQGVRVVFAPGEPHPPKRGDAAAYDWSAVLAALPQHPGDPAP